MVYINYIYIMLFVKMNRSCKCVICCIAYELAERRNGGGGTGIGQAADEVFNRIPVTYREWRSTCHDSYGSQVTADL